jgi:chromosome segregation ATPase
MKKTTPFKPLFLSLIATCLLQSGCATTGIQRSEKAHDSAKDLNQKFGALTKQIEDTVYALDAVVAAGDTGLKAAYDKYTAEFKELASQTKGLKKDSDHFRKHVKAYMASWKEQLTALKNSDIREKAEKRLALAEKQMNEAEDELKNLGEAYDSFLDTLREINIVLENDLNPAGVKAMSGIISKVKRDSKPILSDIDTVMQALAGISQALDTGAPAEG